MRGIPVVAMFVLGAAVQPVGAQDRTESGAAASRTAEDEQVGLAPPLLARFGGTFSLGTVFDSNVDHDQEARDVYGGALGAAFRFLDNPADPSLEVTYEAAVHGYKDGSQWNRVSQFGRVAWETDLPGAWKFEAVGQASLKGNSEDRELSDQYRVEPRLEYRFSDIHRIRLYAAYRLKRYADDSRRDAVNPIVGAEFRQRTPRGESWEIGIRYEENRAHSTRYHYSRWTTRTRMSLPVTRTDRLDVGLAIRFREYPLRFVEVEDEDVSRVDNRWIPSVAWTHTFYGDIDLGVEYRFESRSSNDPDRAFQAHLFGVRVVQRW